MLTILLKTIANTNNNTLAESTADTNTNTAMKSITDTNTNTFVTILLTVYYIQQHSL